MSSPGLSNPAISLPPFLDTQSFLGAHDIRYLAVQNLTTDLPTIGLFESEFAFTLGYQNAEWVILQR